jgi:hypothetical protein
MSSLHAAGDARASAAVATVESTSPTTSTTTAGVR